MSYNLVTKFPYDIVCGANSTGSAYAYSSQIGTWTGSKQGTKVENYRELIAQGLPAGGAYSMEAYKLFKGTPLNDVASLGRDGSQSLFLTSNFIGYPGANWGGGIVSHLVVDTAKAKSVALSKLYKKLESDRSELNSYAVLAEFGDVLRQFGRPFGSIVSAFERHQNRLIFERRRLVGSKTWKDEQFARIAADTWLEVSFGLIPLISDATSVAEAFGRFEYELEESPKLRDRMRTRAVEFTKSMTTFPASSAQPFSYIDYIVERERVTEGRAQYVVGLQGDVRAEFGSNKRLLELLGFEPRNLPLAAWEAVPWSWLVDYFTNVQQILQAGATITTRVKWIVLSEMTQTIDTYRSQLRRAGTPTYNLLNFVTNKKPGKRQGFGSPSGEPEQQRKLKFPPLDAGDFRIVRSTFVRTLPATLGVPPIYFKTPFEDVKKMANLGALVVSRSRDSRTWLS